MVNLVENREVAYTALFEGELPYEPHPSIEDIGLSGLWRAHTTKQARPTNALKAHLNEVPYIVEDILTEHDQLAHEGAADGEAVFSILNSTTLRTISYMTSFAMMAWEKALWRNGERLLLVHDSSDEALHGKDRKQRLAHVVAAKALAIETAAAMLQTLPVFAKNPLKPSRLEKDELAKIVANWGPKFLQEWMDGSILSRWLKAEGVGDEEIEEWQATFTPGIRKHFARNNVDDPLGTLERSKANLDLMTDQAIAERLGWTEAEARDVITPVTRKHFAIHYVDPLQDLEKVRDNLDLLTEEAMARRLQWPRHEVQSMIDPYIRKWLAVNYIADPFVGLDKIKANTELLTEGFIAKHLEWSADEVQAIFTPAILKHTAVRHPNNPLAILDKIKANLELLTDEAIAGRLNWTIAKVQTKITAGLRKYAAVNVPDNPLGAIQNYVKSGRGYGPMANFRSES